MQYDKCPLLPHVSFVKHGDDQHCEIKLCLCLVQFGRRMSASPSTPRVSSIACSSGGERGAAAVRMEWVLAGLLKDETRTTVETDMSTANGVAEDGSSTSFAEYSPVQSNS